MIKLSRKQERLYHELKKAQDEDFYDTYPRITREYVLEKYPTDESANKRLQLGIMGQGFDEHYEEKEIAHIEHNFPGLTRYGCQDPLQDYKNYYKNCKNCPRNKQCERDVERIKHELDMFGTPRDVYRKKKPSTSKTKRSVSRLNTCYGIKTNIGKKAENMLQSIYRVKVSSSNPKRKIIKRKSK